MMPDDGDRCTALPPPGDHYDTGEFFVRWW